MAENDPVEFIIRHRFSLPLNLSVLAWDWGQRGYSCERGTVVEDDWQRERVAQEDRVLCVQDGQLEVLVEGSVRFAADPGDEVFLPDGVRYRLRAAGGGRTRWLLGRQTGHGLDLGRQG